MWLVTTSNGQCSTKLISHPKYLSENERYSQLRHKLQEDE